MAVAPPTVTDHDGYTFDFLNIDERLLHRLLEDAWLQFASHHVQHRATFKDLHGLDHSLIVQQRKTLSSWDQALVAALQTGSFVSNHFQSKFDNSKTDRCPYCDEIDTHHHWPLCPGYIDYIPDTGWAADFPQWPLAMVAHLLPPRNPHFVALKEYFVSQTDNKLEFWSGPSEKVQHIFSDGSATQQASPWLNTASFAVLNATTGKIIKTGHVPGLQQDIDVAELYGLLTGLRWAVRFGCKVHIWLDSKYVADAFYYVQQTGNIPAGWTSQALWQEALDLLHQLEEHPPEVHWIPSHVPPADATNCFEDWLILWNRRVDTLAKQTNECRGPSFSTIHKQAADWHQKTHCALVQLRDFYLAIAKDNTIKEKDSPLDAPDNVQFSYTMAQISDVICIGWRNLVECTNLKSNLTLTFCNRLIDWVVNTESSHTGTAQISYLEILYALLQDQSFSFPYNTGRGHLEDRAPSLWMQRPTIAELLSRIKDAFSVLSRVLGFESHLVLAIDCTGFGVTKPLAGLWLGLDSQTLQVSRESILALSRSRPFRRSSDFARPI